MATTTIKVNDLVTRCKEICDTACKVGEIFVVSRPHNRNVVVISEREYKELAKAKHNAEYTAMINESLEQIRNGEVYEFTLGEMRELEKNGK